MSTAGPSPSYDMASVLFMDIVSYSLRSIDDQTEVLTILQKIVRESAEYQQASSKEEVLSLPTGDGMALVFLRDPVSPAKCALELAASLQSHPEIKLRMGLHTGPVRRHADIKEDVNVVGGGINTAQRVMDCGDAGHILMSKNVAEILEQLRGWNESLQDLGIHEVKHGVKVHLYNLCKDGLGNPELPSKVSTGRSISAGATRPPKSPTSALSRRKWLVVAGFVVLLTIVGFVIRDKMGLGPSLSPASIPLPERKLRYYVTVQKYRDSKVFEKPFRLSGERVFERDYRIRLTLSSLEPGYLYVLNEGAASTPEKPDLNTLFPSPGVRDGSARLDPEQEIQIPPGEYFVFDKQKGKEKLWLVWSTAAIQELEVLKKWVNKQYKGAVRDTAEARGILALLNRYGAAKVEIERDETNRITILKGSGGVFARLIQLEHD